jgi:hypothetical protein
MTQTSKKIEQEIERDFAELEQARDEIALKIHLAGMDAKTTWRELEKKLELLEERINREGAHVADATKALAKELRQSLKQFKARL